MRSKDGRVTTPPIPFATASPGEVYADRLAARYDEQHRLARRYSLLSGWRRLLLGGLVILIVLVDKEGPVAKLVLVGAPALLLGYLIERRVRVARSIWEARWIAGLYEQRLACVEDRWAGTGKPGTRYLTPDHPAAADLDLFGVGSVFERVVTPCTRAGEDTLAGWLLAPAGAPEVRSRQAAVTELRCRLDLREQLAYLAGQASVNHELSQVARWGETAPKLTSHVTRALGALTFSLTVTTMLSGFFFETGTVPVLTHVAQSLENRRDFRACCLQIPWFFGSGNSVLAM
jgi:hypothetical protein